MKLSFTAITKYLSTLDFKSISLQDFYESFTLENDEAVTELLNYIITSANSYKPGSESAFLILKATAIIKHLTLTTEFKESEIEAIKKKACKAKNRLIAIKEIEPTKPRKHHLTKSINMFEKLHFRVDRSEEKVFPILKDYIKNRVAVDYIIEFAQKHPSCFEEVNNNMTIYDFIIEETLLCFPTDEYSYDVYYLFKLLKAFRKKAIIVNDNYIKRICKKKFSKISKKDYALLTELEHIINNDNYELSESDIEYKYGRKKYPDIDETFFSSIIIPTPRPSDVRALTIDPSVSSLKDDAVSISRDGNDYILGIHITNVAGRIEEDSILDEITKQNFKTFYDGPIKANDMIDPKFGYPYFSLNEGQTMPCLSLYVRLSSLGEIKDYYFVFDEVKIEKSLSYEQADQIISEAEPSLLQSDLFTLLELSTMLKDKNKGETYRKIKDLIRPTSYQDYSFSSHSIITEAMVLYNELMATTFANDDEAPFIYRVHAEPNSEEFHNLVDLLASQSDKNYSKDNKELIAQVKHLYPSAYYSEINLGHQGLGLNAYAHTTSPGRRYPDLFAQRLYFKFFAQERSIKDIERYQRMVKDYARMYNFYSAIQPDYFKDIQTLRKK